MKKILFSLVLAGLACFAQAKENFLTDTNRYKLGVEIANSFCKESN